MSTLPNAVFGIRGAWRPARSLLGRWIRAHSADERQAESTYVVVVVTATIGLVLLHILAWAFFGPPSGGDALRTFVIVEVVLGAAIALTTIVGWAPAITVRAGETGLDIVVGYPAVLRHPAAAPEDGETHPARSTVESSGLDGNGLFIPYAAIDGASRVGARTFHRHYRRYAETRVFVNRIEDDLLLLQWNGVPVVIGLPPGDLGVLERIITSHASVESSHVDAA